MLVAELDDVTYDLEVDGEQVRRQLHRKVWERGGWATVAIAYEERASDGTWKAGKLALIRLQKVRDAWKKHAALTLRGADALGGGGAPGAGGGAAARAGGVSYAGGRTAHRRRPCRADSGGGPRSRGPRPAPRRDRAWHRGPHGSA
jgi:hypothetical protein